MKDRSVDKGCGLLQRVVLTSVYRTFGELSRPEELYAKCLELCHALAEDLANEQLVVWLLVFVGCFTHFWLLSEGIGYSQWLHLLLFSVHASTMSQL